MQSKISRSPAQIQELVDAREAKIRVLLQMSSIDLNDVEGLDCGGLTLVANDLWAVCTIEVRKLLLNHEHHFVRSCANIAQDQFSKDSRQTN
jgi:hypothetical protein